MSPPRSSDHTAIVVLVLASTLAVLAMAVVAPILPSLEQAFGHLPRAGLLARLVLVAPTLFIVIGAPIAGLLADRFGRKWLLVGSTLIYAAAGSSGAWVPGLAGLLAGRAVLGLAIGGVMTACATLLADLADGASRRRLFGIQAAAIGVTGAAFVAAGGLLAELAWRTPFLLYLGALLLVPPMLAVLREPAHPGAGRAALGELPVARLAPAWGLIFLTQLLFYLTPIHLPFRLQQLGDPGETVTGLSLATLSAGYAAGALLAAPAARHLERRRVFALGFASVAFSYGGVALPDHWAATIPGLVAAGIGFGLLVPNLFSMVAERTPEALRGRAMGSLTTFLFLGQFASPFVSQPVVVGVGLAGTFAIAGGLGLAAALGLALPRVPGRRLPVAPRRTSA